MSGSTKYLKAVEELASEFGLTVERSKHLKIYAPSGELVHVVGVTPKSVESTLVSLGRALRRWAEVDGGGRDV